MKKTMTRRGLLAGGAAAFTIVRPELVRGAGAEKLKAGLWVAADAGTQAVVNMLTGDPTSNSSRWPTCSKTSWKARWRACAIPSSSRTT